MNRRFDTIPIIIGITQRPTFQFLFYSFLKLKAGILFEVETIKKRKVFFEVQQIIKSSIHQFINQSYFKTLTGEILLMTKTGSNSITKIAINTPALSKIISCRLIKTGAVRT